jgi:acyl carrier protein
MIGLKEEILGKLIKRASEVFNKNPEELNEATRFAEDLNAKSVNIVQITTVMEVEYDVEIPYMEFRRKKTLGEAAEYIKALVEG